MPEARLPIRIKRIPGCYTVNLADGGKLWIYGREAEIANQAHAMTLDEAKQLAKDVASALTEAWGLASDHLSPRSPRRGRSNGGSPLGSTLALFVARLATAADQVLPQVTPNKED